MVFLIGRKERQVARQFLFWGASIPVSFEDTETCVYVFSLAQEGGCQAEHTLQSAFTTEVFGVFLALAEPRVISRKPVVLKR